MSEIYNVLKEVISDAAQIPFDDTKQAITLVEKNSGTTADSLKSVRLSFGKNEKIAEKCIFHFAFKLDEPSYSFLGKLIKEDVKNIRKAVDAIVVCEYKNRKRILLIELKSNANDGFLPKVKSSKLVIEYLKNYLKTFTDINLDDFETRAILFNRKPNKGRKKDFRLTSANNEQFYHQGFTKAEGNIAFIENFIQ